MFGKQHSTATESTQSSSGTEEPMSPKTDPTPLATPRELAAWRAGGDLPFDPAVAGLREALEASIAHPDKVRRRLFLEMARAWHPDKNAENPESTQVFQWLQEEKGNYLGGEATPSRTPVGTPR